MIDTTDKKNFPQGWELVSFGDILKSIKREEAWDDTKLYRLLSVRRRSEGAFHREDLYGNEIKTKNLQPVKQGDFVISKMQIVHGASALIISDFDGFYVSGSYLILHAKNPAKLDLGFLAHLSSHAWFYKVCLESSYGVHIEKMTFNFNLFLKTQFLLPPLPEQRKIAEILSTLDEKMAVIDEQLAQTQELKKGLMQRLLTKGIGHTQFKDSPLGEIPVSWEATKLGNILVQSRLGGNYENGEQEEGLPLIKMGNLGRGIFNLNKVERIPVSTTYLSEDILKEGDLLLNTRNTLELVGKVAIWKSELPIALYNSNLLRMTFDSIRVSNNVFMNYIFNAANAIRQLRSFATGSTSVAAIYSKDLVKLDVALPPLPEQRQIAEILTTVDDKIGVLQDKKAQYHTLKKGLMQQLLTGQRRVRVAAPEVAELV